MNQDGNSPGWEGRIVGLPLTHSVTLGLSFLISEMSEADKMSQSSKLREGPRG